MRRFDEHHDGGFSRRDVLRVGGLALGATVANAIPALARPRTIRNVIQILLVGGPSQLETFDPKPDAPENIRGPFASIRTRVPGIHICELLPRIAQRMNQLALIRSVSHNEPPIHETGQQLLQTGRLNRSGVEWPHFGAVAATFLGPRNGVEPRVILSEPIQNTGVCIGNGQTAGFLNDESLLRFAARRSQAVVDTEQSLSFAARRNEDVSRKLESALNLRWERSATRTRYGASPFGDLCLQARRLVEAGVRVVTVNMFTSVFNQITWDCHANGGDLNATLDDYKASLCPMLDGALSGLLDDLKERGLLDETLVICGGEMGRTPRINNRGGRDHWPACWSVLLAGGGIAGGQVIGRSDAHAAEPLDRPVHPAEIVATVYRALGIDPRRSISAPDGSSLPLVDAQPLFELV